MLNIFDHLKVLLEIIHKISNQSYGKEEKAQDLIWGMVRKRSEQSPTNSRAMKQEEEDMKMSN